MSVYLDHAATSFPKAPPVAAAMHAFIESAAGNPGRGGHRLTIDATRHLEAAREFIAELLGADIDRTLLGSGATFWLNTVLSSVLQKGDRVVTSGLEHNGVMRPLRALQQERGIDITVVDGEASDGVPEADEFAAAVNASPTQLVVVTHASNISGALLPVSEIARRVAPVPVLVDGAQSAGSIPIDFSSMGVAAFVCSGHKGLLGPTGTGVLLLAPDFEIQPLIKGGTGSRSESEIMPHGLPDRFEAGTPNTIGIVGLGAACRWLQNQGISTLHAYQKTMLDRLVMGIESIAGVNLHGRGVVRERVPILSFTCDGFDNGELAAWLDREHGIMLRAGLHCSPAAHRRLGTYPNGTLRVGIGPTTGEDGIDALIDAIREKMEQSQHRRGIQR